MAMGALTAWGISALINAGLILPVTRVPVLTRSGWWHAWALGTVLGATLGWQGWLAVVLYLGLGSTVTKLGFARKAELGIAEAVAEGGARRTFGAQQPQARP